MNLSERDAIEARDDLIEAAERLLGIALKVKEDAKAGDRPARFLGHGGHVDRARQALQVISGNASVLTTGKPAERRSALARELGPFSVAGLSEDLVNAIVTALGQDADRISAVRFEAARLACTSVLGNWMKAAEAELKKGGG